MDFPKKQAQRLMPLYLLEYSEKLFTNHPDPSAPWGGGGGSDYTAGQGITITNNEISVDTNVIATKSDIPTNYVTTDTEQTITGLKTIGETSGTISEVDFSGFTFKLSNKAINHPEADIKIRNSSYDGYQYPTIYSTKGLYVNLAKIKLGDDGNNTYGITMPDSSTWEADRVLATTNDIPSLDGYATETWVQNQGFISNIDLSNYPEIVDVTNGFPDETKTAEILANPSKYILHGTTTNGNYHIFGSYAGYIAANGNTWMQIIRIPAGSGSGYTGYTLQPYAFCYNTGGKWTGPLRFLWKISYGNIYNTPTIPTVNDPTITFTQGGVAKGTITLNQSGDQTIEFDGGASLPDSPFLKVDDPQDQMFFSLDGSDSSWYKYVDLSSAHNKMFYVNLSALNPVFKDGLTSTYNEQTNQLEVGLNQSIPDKTSDLINDSGYVTSSSLATVATTGSYNDLTDKPTIPDTTNFVTKDTEQTITGGKWFEPGKLIVERSGPLRTSLTFTPEKFLFTVENGRKYFNLPTGKPNGTSDQPAEYTFAMTDDIPSTATSTSTSTVTPTTGTFVTGTSTNTADVVNSVTYTPSSETLTFTYADNTTASFTFLTSSTTVTSGTTSVVTSVTDSTSNAMTGATVSTSTTTTLS